MMDARLLSDLLAVSAQAACIVALGGLLPVVLRLDASGARYAWFRLLLVTCLVLPWIQGRHAPATSDVTTSFTLSGVGTAAAPAAAAAQAGTQWVPMVGLILAGGIALRGLWVAIGLLRLRRLRAMGERSEQDQMHEGLQQMLGTRADIRYVAGLRQPVTFGLRRPLVLLPSSLQERPTQVQRAVVSHELIHVQRRDWAWLLVEEGVRAVFWFHPGIWWLISRVQLSREEVVDELAVLATGTRRAYIEALAAFADEASFVPAAAFARRRHLFRRMQLISREAGMSSRRVVISCAVMALAVTLGSWYAVRAFPMLEAAPQQLLKDVGPLERQARPVTPDNPVPRRTYSVTPVYPPEAAAVNANAVVTVMITIDGSGRVAEVRRLGVGPIGAPGAVVDETAWRAALESLVLSAADAVRQWQYDPPAEPPIAVRVTFGFSSTGAPRLMAHDGWSANRPAEFGVVGGRGEASFVGAPPPPPPPPPPGTLRDDRPDWASDAIRIGGAIMAPTKTKHVSPAYPELAKTAKVQGVVILEARIGPDGKVSNARILRSIPLLDQAALDAVMQWEFTPTRLNGQPVPVLMTVTVQFTLT